MTATTYNPLISITSQSTNKTKSFISGIFDLTNKERYVKLAVNIRNNGTESLTAGIISIGDDEFPYGYYDVVIYQNNNNTNVDPDNAIKVIYKTMMNFKAVNNDAVTYTEYTSTITSPTYITNTI
tara:strand:- start:836 stop:1210 length:375 start_codon:yes stop_codon:yes gene_type:complete